MAQVAFEKPVEDSVPKVDQEVAVGEDLEFQRRWWKFEKVVWSLFALILLLDIAGVFGRGPAAHAERKTADGTLDVKYERIERTGTPAVMSVRFGEGAIRNGKVELYVSESMVKELGNQRVVPAPLSTAVGEGGLTYTFPATELPATVEFALQPAAPGVYRLAMGVPGAERMEMRAVVMP